MRALVTRPLPERLADARTRLGVPALGVAIVDVDGPVELAVVGTCRRGETAPAMPDHQWHIGSCGKSMTAALYARLVEQGNAAWDAPLPSLFPDLADRIDPGWGAVTIDDLLLCRAGLPANLDQAALNRAATDDAAPDVQRTVVAASALARPPHRHGRFVYSNLGYIVAGAAIERLVEMPYEAALVAQVLAPLGVASAGFGPPPDIWGHAARKQVGGLCVGAGLPVNPDDDGADNPVVMSPAGRLHVTLADWARFHTTFLRGGADFLSVESIRRLMHVPAGGKMAMGWAPARFKSTTHGMQGSNTFWVATALVDIDRGAAALVVTNDGRTRNLARTAALAAELIAP